MSSPDKEGQIDFQAAFLSAQEALMDAQHEKQRLRQENNKLRRWVSYLINNDPRNRERLMFYELRRGGLLTQRGIERAKEKVVDELLEATSTKESVS